MIMPFLVLACVCVHGGSAQEPARPRLDGHGVPLPDGAVARLGNPHFVQKGVINHIAASSDGRWVATSERHGSEPEHVNLWDARTGRIVRTLTGPTHEIAGIDFSPSGKLLTYRDLGRVWIVDLATFRVEQWPPTGEDGGFYTGVPYYPHPAPRFLDNERLVVWHSMQQEKKLADLSHRISIWERATGKLVRDWRVNDGKIEGLKLESRAFMAGLSPSGATMAWRVLRADSKQEPYRHDVHIFDTLTGAPKGVVRNHPTSSLLASFHDINLFDEGKTLFLKGWFPEAGHDPDGKPISKYGAFLALDVPTGRELYRLGYENGIFRGLAPDGKSFYTFGGEDHRRDFATGKSLTGPLKSYRRQSYYCVFGVTGDGKRTAVAHHNGWYWGDRDMKPLFPQVAEPRADAEVHFVANDRLRVGDGENAFRTWHMRDGKFVLLSSEPPYPSAFTGPMARLCPQRRLAIYESGERMVIHDLEKGQERCRIEKVYRAVHWPIFTNDSRRVLIPQSVLRSKDVMACWFDTQTGRELGRYRIAADDVFFGSYRVRRGKDHVSYSAIDWFADDGSVFGHVAPDGRLVLVESATGKVRATLKVKGTSVSDLGRGEREPVWRFGTRRGSPHIIATRQRSEAEFEHVIYDLTTGVELRRATLPASDTELAALSPDARRAFVVHQGKVIAYETATGRPIGTLPVNVSKGSAVSLAPDGKRLATGCVDTSILIWDVDRPLSGASDLPLPTSVDEAAPLWELLGRADAGAAEPAKWSLQRSPAPALGLLKERLRPLELDAKQIQNWITQLDSATFVTREGAERNLVGLGDPAVPALREALAKPASLEHRRRLESVVMRIGDPSNVPGCLRELRALEVLERIGTRDAKELVARLAAGDPAILATREARLVLARWR